MQLLFVLVWRLECHVEHVASLEYTKKYKTEIFCFILGLHVVCVCVYAHTYEKWILKKVKCLAIINIKFNYRSDVCFTFLLPF